MPRLYYKFDDINNVKCVVCENVFKYEEIKKHLIDIHPNECYACIFCKEIIADEKDLGKHLSLCRKKYHNDPNYFNKK